MNIIKAYYLGFKEAVRLPRPVLLIYFINLLLGMMIILPLYGMMDSELGYSTASGTLLKDFNFSIISDFVNNAQSGINLILGQIKWSLFVYWLVSVFLAGGIIRTLNQDKFTMTSFFSGSGYNFFRFLRISISMILIQLIILFVIWIPTTLIISAFADGVNSEAAIIRTFIIAAIIHFFVILIILMVGDYSKFHAALYDNSKTYKSIKEGFKYVFKNFFKTYGLYLMLVLVPALIVILYFKVDSEIGTHTKFGVIAMFFVQQAFIILRIWFRIWVYSSPLQMYTTDFLKDERVLEKIQIMNQWQEKASKQKEHVLADIMKVDEIQTGEPKEDIGIISESEVLKQMEVEIEMQAQEDAMKKMEQEIAEKTMSKKIAEKLKNEGKTKNTDSDNYFEL